jgi:hypothetical protein
LKSTADAVDQRLFFLAGIDTVNQILRFNGGSSVNVGHDSIIISIINTQHNSDISLDPSLPLMRQRWVATLQQPLARPSALRRETGGKLSCGQ